METILSKIINFFHFKNTCYNILYHNHVLFTITSIGSLFIGFIIYYFDIHYTWGILSIINFPLILILVAVGQIFFFNPTHYIITTILILLNLVIACINGIIIYCAIHLLSHYNVQCIIEDAHIILECTKFTRDIIFTAVIVCCCQFVSVIIEFICCGFITCIKPNKELQHFGRNKKFSHTISTHGTYQPLSTT